VEKSDAASGSFGKPGLCPFSQWTGLPWLLNQELGVPAPGHAQRGESIMGSIQRSIFLGFTALILTCIAGKPRDERNQQEAIFKVGVDTVFLNVSVTDPLNRSVTGVSKEDFRVFEDKVEQEISTFR
jgi:hypothetical protein